MTVRETELPGVGKKFAVDLDGDVGLVVVIHNTGKREVYLDDDPDEDNEKLFELSDKQARLVGSILEGAYFQPIRTEGIETMLDEDTLLEWVKVPGDSPAVGETIAGLDVRGETGASLIAIKRDDGDVITAPGPDDVIRSGDVLVVTCSREAFEGFRNLIEG
ncbi:MAG: cation:proton antiporter regulatory subunit [Halobacteriales archaeon]